MRAGRTALTAFVLAAAAAASAWAGEGRIPLFEPTTIMAPGHYVLTRDVAASGAGGPVFDIQADGVTLDLNEFNVSCAPPDPCIVVGGGGGAMAGVTIRGGTVSGGMYGVHALNAVRRHIVLESLRFVGASDAAVKVDNVGNLEARGIIIINNKVGFEVQGPGPASGIVPCIRVADSMIGAQTGIQCTDASCIIQNNLFSMARSAVRLVNSKGSTVTGNSIFNCPVCFNPQPEPPARGVSVEQSAGVRIQGNSLLGDPTPNGDNHGIYVDAMSPDGFIADNSVTGFGDDGMHLVPPGILVERNLVSSNMGNGIWIAGADSIIDDDKITGNAGDGIVFEGAGIVYRGTVLRANDNPVSGTELASVVDGGGNIQ